MIAGTTVMLVNSCVSSDKSIVVDCGGGGVAVPSDEFEFELDDIFIASLATATSRVLFRDDIVAVDCTWVADASAEI